jgi:probable rRNA maturation factor
VRAALGAGHAAAELCVRIVDEPEMRALNARYRGKDYATNVLAFPAELPPGVELPLLGDIAVCAPVVNREAEAQRKAPRAHWAHMLVHGTLHLLGHDHERARDAAAMEALEKRILAGLDFPDPYQEQ